MAILDYFTGEITLDENIRTELIDAFPALKNDVELNKFDALPKEYINQRLIPELLKIKDHQKLQKLKIALQANVKLRALVNQFAFTPLPPGTMPSREDSIDNIRDSVDQTFQDFTQSLQKLAGLETSEERKEYLTKQIVFRANRARAAMDKTLQGASDGLTHWGGKSWDGKYYGPHGGPINKAFAGNDVGELDQTASDGSFPEVQEEIGNYDKDSVEQMIARVVEQSVRTDSIELTVIDGLTEGYENKEQQMKAALEWLYAAEAGWEQNRDYISFAAKWVKDNAVELGLGTIASLGMSAIAMLLAVAWGVKKFGGTLSNIPGAGLVKKLLPVLTKIPKIGPIAGAVGAIIPSAKPDALMDFKPEAEPMHRAIQDRVLEEMWKQDKATQDAKINDIWARESATLAGAGVTEAEFKSDIRNPSSSVSSRYPALHAEYEASVRSVPGSSLAIDQATYRQSILDPVGGDLVNKGEYDLRVEKALKAQEKFDKAKNRGAQQQAQVAEGRAIAGDVKHPTHRARAAASALTRGRVAPPPVEKPAPAAISQNDAMVHSQTLRDRAKLLEVGDIKLSDGSTIKMTKLDGKTLTALEGLEAEIADAEIKKKEIQDKIDKAVDRMLKEQRFNTLSGASGVVGSIAYQQAEITRLQGVIGGDEQTKTDIEKESKYQEKGKFSKSKVTGADLTKYEIATHNLAQNRPILVAAQAAIAQDKEDLKRIEAERVRVNAKGTYKTEAEMKAYIGNKTNGTTPATGKWAEWEVAESRIKGAKSAMEAHYTELATRYSDRIKWDAAKKTLTIDGVLTEIKKGAARIRGVVAKS